MAFLISSSGFDLTCLKFHATLSTGSTMLKSFEHDY